MTNSRELWKVKDESQKNGVNIEIKDYTKKIYILFSFTDIFVTCDIKGYETNTGFLLAVYLAFHRVILFSGNTSVC